MKRTEIIERAATNLARLVDEHGASNSFLACEVAGGQLWPIHVGRYGREIAAEYQRRTGRHTAYERLTKEQDGRQRFSFFTVDGTD